MKPEMAPLIDKVTAKTIFEENVFYMITWKHKDDTQNTWKPSEFFEEDPFLSALVDRFEEEMKKTEEDLFKKLEKDETHRRKKRQREMDQIKIEDEGKELVWFGNGDDRDRDHPDSKTRARLVNRVQSDKRVHFTPQDQRNLFHKFNPSALDDIQKQPGPDRQTITPQANSHPTAPIRQAPVETGTPGPRIVEEQIRAEPGTGEDKLVPDRAADEMRQEAFRIQEEGTNPAEEEMRRKKLAVFYDLELREKVFDFKNYGHKVLADLRLIADPLREKKLMSVRHAALFQKVPIGD